MRLVAVLWPDNSLTVGDSDGDVLDRVAAEQWSAIDRAGLKHVLSDRVWNWNGSAIDPLLGDTEFLDALQHAGVVLVERFSDA